MILRFVVFVLFLCPSLASAQLFGWPDRRPIARWFTAEHTQTSPNNPRGYLRRSAFDALDPETFREAIMAEVQGIVARMNGMNPRPQGILVWDLEGQEFPHATTYLGLPTALPLLAPEMNAVADEVFATLRQSGYLVGMTVRPQHLQYGVELPPECVPSAPSDWPMQDAFIQVGSPWNSFYECIGDDQWAETPGGFQPFSNDDALIYAQLKAKIGYAVARWGARLFYIDSTVYPGQVPLRGTIFRNLSLDFPFVLLILEQRGVDAERYAADYEDNLTAETPRRALSVVQPYRFDLSLPENQRYLKRHVRVGNILMVDAWWDNPQTTYILRAYNALSPLP